MRLGLAAVCLLSLATGCCKSKDGQKGASSSGDALWKLAPADTTIGFVVAPGAAPALLKAIAGTLDVIGKRPEGATLIAELKRGLKEAPFDVLQTDRFEDIGLDLDRGAALFLDAKGAARLVLPVVDRTAFLLATNGSEEIIDGEVYDRHGSNLLCAPKGDAYVCSKDVAGLKAVGGPSSPLAQKVLARPARERGAIELAFDIPKLEGMPLAAKDVAPYLASPSLALIAGEVVPGQLNLRIRIVGTPVHPVFKGASEVRSVLIPRAREEHATSLLQLRVPPILWGGKAADEVVLPGAVRLYQDLLPHLTGELVAFTPNADSLFGRVLVGVDDEALFRRVIAQGCKVLATFGAPGLTARGDQESCTLGMEPKSFPPAASLAKELGSSVAIRADVAGGAVRLQLGTPGPAKAPTHASTVGDVLLGGSWNVALWAQHVSAASGLHRPLSKLLGDASSASVDRAALGIWLLAQVSEVGVAGAVRADGIEARLHLGFYSADPKDAFLAYLDAVSASIDDGDSAQLAELGTKFPNSQAAKASDSPVARLTGSLMSSALEAFASQDQPRDTKTPQTPRLPKPPSSPQPGPFR